MTDGLVCPVCAHETRVTDSRPLTSMIRRRRACLKTGCGHRFTTYEMAGVVGAKNLGYGIGHIVGSLRKRVYRLGIEQEAISVDLERVASLLGLLEGASRRRDG